jgi:DNA-binding NarL/FixJ family response regulator
VIIATAAGAIGTALIAVLPALLSSHISGRESRGGDSMSDRIRVMVADDHAQTREHIRVSLEQDERFRVCAECADAAEAIHAAIREQPDVCLLEVRLPGSGVAAAWEIRARLPRTRIVMLTVSREDGDLFAALHAGASGYLLKDMDPRRLPQTLDAVLCGEVAIPRELVGHLVDEFRDPAARRRRPVAEVSKPRLTSREWEVLDLLRRNLTTSQIARRLVLSPVTVRTHVKAIVDKLDVSDRDELLRLFQQR